MHATLGDMIALLCIKYHSYTVCIAGTSSTTMSILIEACDIHELENPKCHILETNVIHTYKKIDDGGWVV